MNTDWRGLGALICALLWLGACSQEEAVFPAKLGVAHVAVDPKPRVTRAFDGFDTQARQNLQ